MVLIMGQAALKGLNTQFMQLLLQVGVCCYTHHTDEESEAQKAEETCPPQKQSYNSK